MDVGYIYCEAYCYCRIYLEIENTVVLPQPRNGFFRTILYKKNALEFNFYELLTHEF